MVKIKKHQPTHLKLFFGKKTQWQPLLQRLLARLSALSEVEVCPFLHSISLCRQKKTPKTFGKIRILVKGIEIGLNLGKIKALPSRLKKYSGKSKAITHVLRLKEIRDIDEEFLSMVRVACQQAHTPKSRSL